MDQKAFQWTIWIFCGLSALFLASRLAVRMWKKGRLRKSDYLLVPALPCLLTGCVLLQINVDVLFERGAGVPLPQTAHGKTPGKSSLYVGSVELLWLAIYLVKASFLAQFKFHKAPYAYISFHLTRYYWATIIICSLSFLSTLVVPVMLCSSSCWYHLAVPLTRLTTAARCSYSSGTDTIVWEIVVTTLDIVTDVMIIAVPVILVKMAHFTLLRATVNTFFKSLSILAISIAASRLAVQYNREERRVDYPKLTLWLAIEAAVAVIAASISTYRIVVIDQLANIDTRQQRLANSDPRSRSRGNSQQIDVFQRSKAKITSFIEHRGHESQLELAPTQCANGN